MRKPRCKACSIGRKAADPGLGETPASALEFLDERSEYDVAGMAKHIISNHMDDMAVRQYLENEWNRSNTKWTAFFEYQNFKAFRKAVQMDAIV